MTKTTNNIRLADVAGYEEEKAELAKLVKLFSNYKEYEAKGVYVPKGLILQGPPGCGKTLMVKAIAGECGIPFFNFEPSEMADNVLADLKKVFNAAKKQKPSIVYIDEIDKIVTNRHYASDQTRAVVQYLLTTLDAITSTAGTMVIASTNCYNDIPESLLRSGRMDKKILIDYPDVKSRIAILNYYTKGKEIFSKLNIKALAVKLEGMSGADIKTLLNNALIEYIDAKDFIEVDDFQKLINEMSFETIGKKWDNKIILHKVLAHEVGHSIVGFFTTGNAGLISGIRYGDTAGFTSFDDEYEVSEPDPVDANKNASKIDVLNNVRKALGGMAAELVFYKEYDTGVGSDLNQATTWINIGQESMFFGTNYLPQYYSNDTETNKNKRYQLRNKILTRELKTAKSIITRYKYLCYYLIDEAIKNDDTLSNAQIMNCIRHYQENPKKIKKEFKNYKMED